MLSNLQYAEIQIENIWRKLNTRDNEPPKWKREAFAFTYAQVGAWKLKNYEII